MVKYGNGDTATDMTDKAKENLKSVFDDMCSYTITSRTDTSTDEEGNTTSTTVKEVNVKLKTYHDMISEYGFDEERLCYRFGKFPLDDLRRRHLTFALCISLPHWSVLSEPFREDWRDDFSNHAAICGFQGRDSHVLPPVGCKVPVAAHTDGFAHAVQRSG